MEPLLGTDSLILTCGVLLVTAHVALCGNDWYRAVCKIRVHDLFSATVARSTSTSVSEEEQYVANELAAFRLGNFRLFCSMIKHVALPVILLILQDTRKKQSISMMFCMACVLLGYCTIVAADRYRWQVESRQMTLAGISLSAVNVGAAITTAYLDKEDYALKHSLCFIGQLLIGGLCCNRAINIPSSLALAATSISSYVNVHGWERLDALFLLVEVLELCACIIFPAVLELVVSMRSRATYGSIEATSLTTGFRCMIKGICDGDLVLDGDLRMCHGTACLQRLLSADEDYVGKRFPDLVGEEFKDELEQFLLAGQDSTHPIYVPTCMHIKLAAPNGPCGVDVYHVLLPRPVGRPYHLLAITENSEAAVPDARPASIPGSLLHTHQCDEAAESFSSFTFSQHSERSDVSDASDIVIEPCPELQQVSLMLDGSSSTFDVNEMYVRFAPAELCDRPRLVTPALKGLMPPIHWSRLEEQLQQYLQLLHVNPNVGPLELESVRLRLPGETRRAVLARSATLVPTQSKYQRDGHRSVSLCLHLTDFQWTSSRCSRPPRLADLREHDEDYEESPASSTASVSAASERQRLLMQMRRAARVLNAMG